MVQRKKGGGPKTPAGKAIASKNATKHNLRSAKPATLEEQQKIIAYAAQLVEHYEADDPLEILQLERIALYREKLAKVYQAELAAAQFAHDELENHPEKIVQEMGHLSPTAQGRLLEFIKIGQWLLPCGLSDQVLDDICLQIHTLDVPLKSNEDIEKYLPALASYLQSYHSSSVEEDATLVQKLSAVCARLEYMMSKGSEYRVIMSAITDLIMQNKQKREDAVNEELSQEQDELDLYIAKRQAELRGKMKRRPDSEANGKVIAGEREKSTESFLSAQKLEDYLALFIKVQHAMVSAQVGLKQFESTKAMRLQMLALPNAQSELLLRYQTTWERRLSAAIGEYLELRKRNQRPA